MFFRLSFPALTTGTIGVFDVNRKTTVFSSPLKRRKERYILPTPSFRQNHACPIDEYFGTCNPFCPVALTVWLEFFW